MTFFASGGMWFSFEGLLYYFAFFLLLEGSLALAIAVVLSHLLRMQEHKILFIGTIALLACAAFSIYLDSPFIMLYLLPGVSACACLCVMYWLYSLIATGRGDDTDERFCFLNLSDRPGNGLAGNE